MVQRLILTRLAGENLLAHSRIEFSTMGAGYSCIVATHGSSASMATKWIRGTMSVTNRCRRLRGA